MRARLVANFGPKVDEDSLLQQLRLQQPDITDLFAAKAPPHSRPALDSTLLQRSSLLTLSPTAAGFSGPQQAFPGPAPVPPMGSLHSVPVRDDVATEDVNVASSGAAAALSHDDNAMPASGRDAAAVSRDAADDEGEYAESGMASAEGYNHSMLLADGDGEEGSWGEEEGARPSQPTLGQMAAQVQAQARAQARARGLDADIDLGVEPREPGICTPGTEHTGRWTTKEHETFLQALKLYGKEWKKVAAMVKTRTVVQTRTHAQKYFQKLQKLRSAGGTVTEDGLRAIDAGMTVPVGPESLGSSSSQAVRKKGVSAKRPKREGAFGELDDDDLRERGDSLSPVPAFWATTAGRARWAAWFARKTLSRSTALGASGVHVARALTVQRALASRARPRRPAQVPDAFARGVRQAQARRARRRGDARTSGEPDGRRSGRSA